MMEIVGDWLAAILILVAVFLLGYAVLQGKRIKDSMKRIINQRLSSS
jgi:hypothetical protein